MSRLGLGSERRRASDGCGERCGCGVWFMRGRPAPNVWGRQESTGNRIQRCFCNWRSGLLVVVIHRRADVIRRDIVPRVSVNKLAYDPLEPCTKGWYLGFLEYVGKRGEARCLVPRHPFSSLHLPIHGVTLLQPPSLVTVRG
jgi:hypothetical protein